MRSNTYQLGLCALLCSLEFTPLFAKGENELGTAFSYFNRQSQVDGEKVKSSELTLDGLYLRSFKSIWSGGELSYLSSVSDNHLNLGVPVKYWMKGPDAKGVGVYAVATPYFGKVDSSDETGTVMGLRMGPGLVVFLNDMLGIDIKIYYDYRRIGSSPSTTTGLKIGFSVYF